MHSAMNLIKKYRLLLLVIAIGAISVGMFAFGAQTPIESNKSTQIVPMLEVTPEVTPKSDQVVRQVLWTLPHDEQHDPDRMWVNPVNPNEIMYQVNHELHLIKDGKSVKIADNAIFSRIGNTMYVHEEWGWADTGVFAGKIFLYQMDELFKWEVIIFHSDDTFEQGAYDPQALKSYFVWLDKIEEGKKIASLFEEPNDTVKPNGDQAATFVYFNRNMIGVSIQDKNYVQRTGGAAPIKGASITTGSVAEFEWYDQHVVVLYDFENSGYRWLRDDNTNGEIMLNLPHHDLTDDISVPGIIARAEIVENTIELVEYKYTIK